MSNGTLVPYRNGTPVASDFAGNVGGAPLLIDDLNGNLWCKWANGTIFEIPTGGSGGGDMYKSENLSGLANYTTARSNLGLGTAAVTNATAYATAAQGATADSALQPGGNGSGLSGLTKAQVGLANADNTSDANKPVSSATQTALNAKQDTLVSGTNIKTINGSTILGSGNIAVSASVSQATVSLPYASRSHRVSVTDAAVSPASKILLSLAGVPETQANSSDSVDLESMQAVPGTGSFIFQASFKTPFGGPLVVNYAVG